MAYFAGPNVRVSIKSSEPIGNVIATSEVLSECAGVSYVLNNSQQPIYGYASTQFDAMLPGREIVQGNLLLNHTSPIPFYEILNKSSNTSNSEGLISYNGFLNEPLDIIIKFKKDHEIIINYCYIFSRGETIQISEQGIVEEYSFIGRSLSYKKGE